MKMPPADEEDRSARCWPHAESVSINVELRPEDAAARAVAGVDLDAVSREVSAAPLVE